MTWWKKSLFDTCSLVTLNKLLLERQALGRHFPRSILALSRSFSSDQLRQETVQLLKHRVTIQELPSSREIERTLLSAGLPKTLADVDYLYYATAVHFGLSVITNNRQLGLAISKTGLQVADMAFVLRNLVKSKRLTTRACECLLRGLVRRNDFLLGTPSPTWALLEKHVFLDGD